MHPLQIYKLFGPISVGATGLAIALMIYKWRGDRGISISHNAAANKHSYLLMFAVQTITLPMLCLFWVKWLAVMLELPAVFTILAVLCCIGLLLAAWIPAAQGWKGKAHGIFANGAGVLVLPMLILMFESPSISTVARATVAIVFLYELVVIAIFAKSKKRPWHLYLEAGYIFLFALSTVIAAYL